jgi:2-methylcitrate dehydratase PrpD
LFGEVTLAQFEQEVIDDPARARLLHRVKVVTEDRLTQVYPDHWGCEVRATLRDGRVVKKYIKTPRAAYPTR